MAICCRVKQRDHDRLVSPSQRCDRGFGRQESRRGGVPAGVGGWRGVEVFIRPIGRWRTRSAANPGEAGRCAGPHERLGSHRRNRKVTRHDSSKDSAAREPPAHARPRSARYEPSGGSRVRGARGRSSASAVPSQRRSFVSREPQSGRLRPPVASRETSGISVRRARAARKQDRQKTDRRDADGLGELLWTNRHRLAFRRFRLQSAAFAWRECSARGFDLHPEPNSRRIGEFFPGKNSNG